MNNNNYNNKEKHCSLPVAESIYVNIYLKNSFAYAKNADSSRVRYAHNIKSAGFRSNLEAFGMSSNIVEL